MIKNAKKIFKLKNYPHFDIKKHYNKYQKYLIDPNWVTKHGFHPFIHFTIKTWKFDGNEPKEKNRNIYYSAHIDRYIYEFYGSKLNTIYNSVAKLIGINNSSIAYRTNLHKNNIHFAKEVFDFIKKNNNSFVLVGDFTDYFDSLDHKYLKNQLLKLLEADKLQEDYYKVFKSITKFSFVEYNDVLKKLSCSKKDLNKLNRIFDTSEYQQFKKQNLRKNQNTFGIPQGSSISAVLSNIYMLDFDKKINDFATSRCGMYRRYCDDIIIIIPVNNKNDIDKYYSYISDTIKDIPRLNLQPTKTRIFYYSNNSILDVGKNCIQDYKFNNNILDYLGFSYDGVQIKIRDKSIFKFYSRLHQKIKIANKYSKKFGRNVFRKRLFKLYSHFGAKRNKNWKGNFLLYVKRAQKVFYDNPEISNQVKKHWKIINKKLIDVVNHGDSKK